MLPTNIAGSLGWFSTTTYSGVIVTRKVVLIIFNDIQTQPEKDCMLKYEIALENIIHIVI